MSNKMKTVKIQGKAYVLVNERIMAFRQEPAYKGYSLESEVVFMDWDKGIIVMKAFIKNPMGQTVATGHAQEKVSTKGVNFSSALENCETSAWGRCLAALGIGIEDYIASADEMASAIAQQEAQESKERMDQGNADFAKAFADTIDESRAIEIGNIIKQSGGTLAKFLSRYNINNLKELTAVQANEIEQKCKARMNG